MFQQGQKVIIQDHHCTGHHRVPAYVKGVAGLITEVLTAHPKPEQIAIGEPAPDVVPVYRVRLRQQDLWPDYPANLNDTLEIEIYQHWLRNAEPSDHMGFK